MAAAALVVAMAAGCGGSPPAGPLLGQSTAVPEEKPVTLVLTRTDGEKIDIRAMRGEPLLLYLFTTHDISCQVALKPLRAFMKKRPGLQAVGIVVQPDPETLLPVYEDFAGLPFSLAYDPQDRVKSGLSDLGLIQVVPTYVLLDAEGFIVARREGTATVEELEKLLDSAR
jgi:peroxiredoxin